MNKIIRFLQSESFIFVTLVFVLTGQIIHTMYLFESVKVADLSISYEGETLNVLNWGHAFIFALAIESAILMFILNGKIMPSKIYAVGSFATNVLYYEAWYHGIPEMVTTLLISAMLAGSIWFFSELFVEKLQGKTHKPKTPGAYEDELSASLTAYQPENGKNGHHIYKTTMPNGR